MKGFKLLAAVAAAGALGATSASATIMQAAYTGVIYAGVDSVGLFAAPGTDLTGEAFEFDFVYDTAAGTVVPFLTGQALQAGSGQPVLAASVTILGHTVSPGGLNGLYPNAAFDVPDFGQPSYP